MRFILKAKEGENNYPTTVEQLEAVVQKCPQH